MNPNFQSNQVPFMKTAQWLVACMAIIVLTACGGGSSGSFDAGREGRISITPLQASIEAAAFECRPSAQVNVRLVNANGTSVADGTVVSLSSSNSASGTVDSLQGDSPGGSATAPTSGGTAQFRFFSGTQPGPVTLTASATNPSGVGTVTATQVITVIPSSCQEPQPRLLILGDRTMPTNPAGVPIFLGSPYINELTVRYTGPDGNAGVVEGGEIAVAVSPVNRGAFSTLDDPATPDVNEFFVLLGSGPVNMTAGVTTLFIHSFDRPGPLTVSVTAQDANTGERFSQDFIIEIEDGAADFLPAEVGFSISPDPVYVTGSGGATTKPIALNVLDSGGNPVPNPSVDGNAFNNVLLELDAPPGSGARLTGTGANGPVSGTSISVRTVNGIANFALNAGSLPGSHRIIATVDRADNNVDNGIQDALSAQTTVQVGDGQIFAVRLVNPILNAINVNPTSPLIETSFEPTVDPITGAFIPPNPDGTYSLTVSVIATDRAGNPPLPGQPLSFGKLDAPVSNTLPKFFVLSGMDGDPEEGGLLFTAENPAQGFLNVPGQANEAVEVGDTLALFGKSVPGNREHEAARFVASVIDNRTLLVTEPFNPNDGTGQIVDDGPVIPWVIGRSQVGNVGSTVNLNAQGRGSVQLTYPINSLGSPLVLWSQGSRLEGSGSKTVADVESLVFPGVAPLILTASPSAVPGNASAPVLLCVTDGLRAPIEGLFVRGSVTDGTATGTLDGSPMPAFTAQATGTADSGCVVTEVTTSGMIPGGDPSTITFAIGQAQVEIEVVPPGAARLLVEPSTVTDNIRDGFQRQVTLRLLNPAGEPISGVGLVGSCDGGDGTLELVQTPGVTGPDGRTSAQVFIAMAGCGDSANDESFPRTGQCTFTTNSGEPVGVFTAIGLDLRSLPPGVGPLPPAFECPPLDQGAFRLVVDVRAPAGTISRVISDPEGIDCGVFQDGQLLEEATDCIAQFDISEVVLQAPLGSSPVWSGDCQALPGSGRFASVDLEAADSPAVCAVDYN